MPTSQAKVPTDAAPATPSSCSRTWARRAGRGAWTASRTADGWCSSTAPARCGPRVATCCWWRRPPTRSRSATSRTCSPGTWNASAPAASSSSPGPTTPTAHPRELCVDTGPVEARTRSSVGSTTVSGRLSRSRPTSARPGLFHRAGDRRERRVAEVGAEDVVVADHLTRRAPHPALLQPAQHADREQVVERDQRGGARVEQRVAGGRARDLGRPGMADLLATSAAVVGHRGLIARHRASFSPTSPRARRRRRCHGGRARSGARRLADSGRRSMTTLCTPRTFRFTVTTGISRQPRPVPVRTVATTPGWPRHR